MSEVAANVLAAPAHRAGAGDRPTRGAPWQGRVVGHSSGGGVEDGVVRSDRRLGLHHVSTIARSDLTALLMQASW
ncbi:MAG: hypothetical protein ABIQ52_17470 [Vicinamibacterales bacterium]